MLLSRFSLGLEVLLNLTGYLLYGSGNSRAILLIKLLVALETGVFGSNSARTASSVRLELVACSAIKVYRCIGHDAVYSLPVGGVS